MSHTPGPWNTNGASKASNFGDWTARVRANDHGPVTVAKVLAGNGSNDTKEIAEANARLIAAAPELLAALESLVGKAWVRDTPEHLAAEAAIKKARGE
jgi:hypothetical protein